jgi:hypothetical protein
MDDESNPGPTGNKNPPVHTRWKKGQSGNPNGRPKGSGLIREALRKAALARADELWVGQGVKCTQVEAVIQACFKHAIRGQVRAASTVISLLNHFDDEESGGL